MTITLSSIRIRHRSNMDSAVSFPAATAPDAANTNSESAFLRLLPAEMRVKVYREVFRGLQIQWRESYNHHAPARLVRVDDYGRVPNGLALLQISHVIRQEALPILNGTIYHRCSPLDLLGYPSHHPIFPSDKVVNLRLSKFPITRVDVPRLTRIFPRFQTIDIPDETVLNFSSDPQYFNGPDFPSDDEVRRGIFGRVSQEVANMSLYGQKPPECGSMKTLDGALYVSLMPGYLLLLVSRMQ